MVTRSRLERAIGMTGIQDESDVFSVFAVVPFLSKGCRLDFFKNLFLEKQHAQAHAGKFNCPTVWEGNGITSLAQDRASLNGPLARSPFRMSLMPFLDQKKQNSATCPLGRSHGTAILDQCSSLRSLT